MGGWVLWVLWEQGWVDGCWGVTRGVVAPQLCPAALGVRTCHSPRRAHTAFTAAQRAFPHTSLLLLTHLDGEHHAHKACSQQGHPERLGPHQQQLVLGVAPVDLACSSSSSRMPHTKLVLKQTLTLSTVSSSLQLCLGLSGRRCVTPPRAHPPTFADAPHHLAAEYEAGDCPEQPPRRFQAVEKLQRRRRCAGGCFQHLHRGCGSSGSESGRVLRHSRHSNQVVRHCAVGP